MKYTKHLLAAGLLISLSTMTAQAALLSRGGGTMFYDTVEDVTWVTDAHLFKTQAASDPSLISTIIANVGTVLYGNEPHVLTTNDFYTDFDNNVFVMSWLGAQAYVENLNYGGVSDWRLPMVSTLNWVPVTGEFASIFNPDNEREPGVSFLNMYGFGGPGTWVTGTYDQESFWVVDTMLYQYTRTVDHGFQLAGGVWAVRDGDVAAVPVPAAAWLFGSALFGFVGLKQRNRIA